MVRSGQHTGVGLTSDVGSPTPPAVASPRCTLKQCLYTGNQSRARAPLLWVGRRLTRVRIGGWRDIDGLLPCFDGGVYVI